MNIKNRPILAMMILALSALLVVSQLYIPIPLIGLFSQTFQVTPATAVWIGSGFGFAYAAGFLVFGPLSDHLGRRNLLIPGLFLLAIITLILATVNSFTDLLALRIVQGFIAATFAPAALAYISEQLPPSLRPTAIACVSTGFMVAGVLGQLYASEVANHFNWQAIFWSSGILYAVFASLVLFFVREEKSTLPQGKKSSLKSFYLAMPAHLLNPNLLVAYVCSFFLLLSFVAMYSGLAPYLHKQYQFNADQLFYVRAVGLLGMIVAPFAGQFIRRFGNKKILYIGFILAAISILLESFLSSSVLIVAFTVPFVAGVAISAPALISFISTTALEAKGAAISLYTFVLFLGAALGSILANSLSAYGFKFLGLTIFAVLILSIAVFMLVQKMCNETACVVRNNS